jgi:hypothetical protein
VKIPAVFVRGGLLAATIALSGCTILEDNGTHLAFALERGAKKLRASNLSEYVVHYEPLEGINETYEINMIHSREVVQVDVFGNTLRPGGSSLTVTGRNNGGTNYHERFVFTPRDLHIVKTNAPAEVVLRKVGDRIDVVELR